jgi:Tc toxin complex TcA C-terminal TcB-binding domain/Neuraminidase-like domain/Hemopexin
MNDWLQLSKQLHDELNLVKRDTLVPYVIAQEETIDDERGLYEQLLIDVNMGSCGTTSKIEEAIAATQLYFHRYFVNLESGVQISDAIDPEARKQELKNYWKWIKNYRVWEANRKVFLYPENYIRPELRDTKTPAFKTLEEDLLQGEITEEAAERVYRKYLEEYTEVSRLTIAGGYVYDSSELSGPAKSLVLFGRTKTDPRRYYYRMAKFLGGEKGATTWEPWLKVNVQIDADKVYPVFAFNRVFVFWTKVETVAATPSNSAITTTETAKQGGTSQTFVSNTQPPIYVVKIYYSFYNLNKEWVPPQALDADMRSQQGIEFKGGIFTLTVKLELENIGLLVETSDKLRNVQGLGDSAHDNIIINCTYDLVTSVLVQSKPQADKPAVSNVQSSTATISRTFSLTPELYTVDLGNQPRFNNPDAAIFQEIFAEPAIAKDNVVMLNTTQQSIEGPWFSFDYKGGSFLCKPDTAILDANAWPKLIPGNREGLPSWPRIDAAVQLPKGPTFFFRNDQQKYVASAKLSDRTLSPEQDIKTVWGKVDHNIARTGVIDAAYLDRNSRKTYLFSGNQYVVYSRLGDYEWIDEGYPQPIMAHPENRPQLSQIDAAFQGKDGKIYLFNNATQKYYIVSGSNVTTKNIRDDWRVATTTTFILDAAPSPDDPEAPSIDAGFVYNGLTYLLNRNSFVKYTEASYQFIAEAPKPNTFIDLLNDLGYTAVNSAEADQLRTEVVVASYDQDSTLYFTTRVGKTKKFKNYEYKNRKLTLSDSERPMTAAFAIAGVAYRFFSNQLVVSNSEATTDLNKVINAAFAGTDNFIYIFRKADYITIPKNGLTLQSLIETINSWPNPQPNDAKWGKSLNNIARTGMVDAAFCDGEKTYLFSGDEYLVYSGDTYQAPDPGYPKKISTNTENLPKWNKIDAAVLTLSVNGEKGPLYFFDNSDQTFVQSGSLGTKRATTSQWGRIKNNIAQQGRIDTAFVKEGALFLTSGDQLFRYSFRSEQSNGPIAPTLGEFVDLGYPKPIRWGVSRIDAAFNLGDKTYIFSGNAYGRLQSSLDFDRPPNFKFIQGNWGNLPQDLKSGLDAALDTPNDLFLFQGDRYIKYANLTDPTSVKPFEISEMTYEIVRLTTSTAYKLNQKLFSGGLPELLSLSTQEIDDTPSFSLDSNIPQEALATTIKVKPGKVSLENLPSSSHLDFNSANGIYYWEIFFHAPHLVAQALNLGQKFDEAKTWYEYIYDPTSMEHYWKFLPFLAIDIQAIVTAGRLALGQIQGGPVDIGGIAPSLTQLFTDLEPLADAFQSRRKLTANETAYLISPFLIATVRETQGVLGSIPTNGLSDRHRKAIAQLGELAGMIEKLASRYKLLSTNAAQLEVFLTDPFDPHAIAALRRIAYRKAIVMAYIDNLIDWGDMLFQQYTRESINEARMLYILAYDLLGQKPENLGTAVLSPAKPYGELSDASEAYDLLLSSTVGESVEIIPGSPMASMANPYFFIPDNPIFGDYWTRVEDRLYKIRHCLNIMGISQPLPLFEPPIDPMALVQAVSTGAGLSSALASLNIPVPHYRFDFMLGKAKELVQKLGQFGNDLLSALEKQDAEALSLLQNRQEGEILAMTRSIKADQLKEAEHNHAALTESLASATHQFSHYQGLLDEGLTDTESAQIAMMIIGSALMTGAGVVKIAGAIAYGVPQFTIGPFSFGSTTGGQELGESLSKISEALESTGDGLSMVGDVLGIYAQHERSMQDWTLQKALAASEQKQLASQIEGAILQKAMAQREIEILEKQIAQNASISIYMKDKFSNVQLYQWMASRLSGLYFQTYQMAFDMAKAAEKAFQFERGIKESEVNFIRGSYWDSQRKGLLAGDGLGVDLDRMEKAYIDTNRRGFEISKNISLLDLDPLALLQLKSKGVCEFSFPETLFDYDFPGHYCRQIRTLSLTFDAGEGETVMATLTQLNHRTVLEPDPKAVKYLLDPKDQPPLSIRNGWKANQQIALSHVGEGEKNNGLFELRFDDERYLPFENTGAVSTWRLELNGKRGAYRVNALRDVIINLKYSAEQGGSAFASAVKGLLKPYPTARFFDLAQEFPDQWAAFIDGETDELVIPLSRDLFPNMGSGKISGIFAHYDLAAPGSVSMVLNGDNALILKEGKFLPTNGLSISGRGVEWMLTVSGDKQIINNVGLVLGYKATVT